MASSKLNLALLYSAAIPVSVTIGYTWLAQETDSLDGENTKGIVIFIIAMTTLQTVC